jgi:hypothetical protein
MMDYIYLMSATANVVENEYDNEKYHFILPISYSNEIYAQGRIYQEIDDMVKEKQKK